MKIYLVGGAVRDELLGLPLVERDWVVVGATEADMQALGYRQVGKDFPVFLHPETHEEYALARKERKTKPGYTGFDFDTSPDVTLEEDLLRRDLTINAIAKDVVTGEYIDPYQGRLHIEQRLLQHVSDAFVEDPVRVLRVARFAARFQPLGFTVASVTNQFMQTMVQSGEVNALVAERVWKEWEKALQEPAPQVFFEVLMHCGAEKILFPEMDTVALQQLRRVAERSTETTWRFAGLLAGISLEAIQSLCDRYRVPTQYADLAKLLSKHQATILGLETASAEILLELFYMADAFRRPERFSAVCHVLQCLYPELLVRLSQVFACLEALRALDVQALTVGFAGKAIAEKIYEARLQYLCLHWKG